MPGPICHFLCWLDLPILLCASLRLYLSLLLSLVVLCIGKACRYDYARVIRNFSRYALRFNVCQLLVNLHVKLTGTLGLHSEAWRTVPSDSSVLIFASTTQFSFRAIKDLFKMCPGRHLHYSSIFSNLLTINFNLCPSEILSK